MDVGNDLRPAGPRGDRHADAVAETGNARFGDAFSYLGPS
jgi:hypothetical protein